MLGVDPLQSLGDGAAKCFGIAKRKPHMLIVFFFLMLRRILFGLHTGHKFLCFHGILQHIQQIDHFPIRVGRFLERILYPALRLAAHIQKQVAVGDLDHILRCRLIAVQVNAAVQQQGHIGIFCLITQNLFCPVIFRKNRGHDLHFILLCAFIGYRHAARHAVSGAAACQKRSCHAKCQGSCDFFSLIHKK